MEQNTVIISVDKYERLLTDKYIAQEELRDARTKLNKMNNLKAYILNNSLDKYNMRTYSLDKLTNINSFEFGIDNSDKLLELGFELDEMIEFIKFKYEEAHREEQENDN